MKAVILAFVLDNILPIILTMVLGILGAKLAHVKDAMGTIADAMADGKVSKAEWADIRLKVKTLIGR